MGIWSWSKDLGGKTLGGKFPTFEAPLSVMFHSCRLIFGRAVISRLFSGTIARGTLVLKRPRITRFPPRSKDAFLASSSRHAATTPSDRPTSAKAMSPAFRSQKAAGTSSSAWPGGTHHGAGAAAYDSYSQYYL